MSLPLGSPRANVRNAPRPKAKYKFRDERSQQKLNARDVTRATEALAQGQPLDPIDPADRAAVEAHFESIAGGFAELPPQDRAMALRDYVVKLGVMPDALVRGFRGGLLSDDPAAQVSAAQRIAALERENPELVTDIPEHERRRAAASERAKILANRPLRAIFARMIPSFRSLSLNLWNSMP